MALTIGPGMTINAGVTLNGGPASAVLLSASSLTSQAYHAYFGGTPTVYFFTESQANQFYAASPSTYYVIGADGTQTKFNGVTLGAVTPNGPYWDVTASGGTITVGTYLSGASTFKIYYNNVFSLGTDFTGTILGNYFNNTGYIRVESNTGPPNFSQAPISTRFYNFLTTLTAGTNFTVRAVDGGTTYNTILSFTNFASPGTASTGRNDLYWTKVSGDELPFSYGATELTLTF
jgi:hypothetical protein